MIPSLSVGFLIFGVSLLAEILTVSKHPNSLANLKPFVQGQSGNPTGAKKRVITKDTYAAIAEKYLTQSTTELRKLSLDDSVSAIDRMVITQILSAIDKNQVAENLMGYCIGKAAEVHQIEAKQWTDDLKTIPIDTLKQISKGEE